MSEIEKLRAQLESLKCLQPGAGSTLTNVGHWLVEIGKLNLAIAELMLPK